MMSPSSLAIQRASSSASKGLWEILFDESVITSHNNLYLAKAFPIPHLPRQRDNDFDASSASSQ